MFPPSRGVSPVDLRELVREIPDFPTAGILFKDITPLLLDPVALEGAVSIWLRLRVRSAWSS